MILVGEKKSRWIAHRFTAHKMNERGQSLDVIADHLRISARTVTRYLDLPCPEQPAREVALEDFFMDGSCGGFPELDWQTRKLTMQRDCKAVCEYCPVLSKCRAYGLTKGCDDAGIWGGLTRNERQREVARRRRAEGAGQADTRTDADEQGVA
jgi:WhiB family redox-sensing transcriptional regulator